MVRSKPCSDRVLWLGFLVHTLSELVTRQAVCCPPDEETEGATGVRVCPKVKSPNPSSLCPRTFRQMSLNSSPASSLGETSIFPRPGCSEHSSKTDGQNVGSWRRPVGSPSRVASEALSIFFAQAVLQGPIFWSQRLSSTAKTYCLGCHQTVTTSVTAFVMRGASRALELADCVKT